MHTTAALLPALLSRARPEAERLAALADLAGSVHGQEVIDALLAIARDEPAQAVRGAILELVAGTAITRISDRAAHADAWLAIAASETVVSLRRLAVRRLVDAGLATGTAATDFLAGVLVHELDADVRAVCLAGLNAATQLSTEAIASLVAYAPRASAAEDAQFLAIAPRLPAAAGQAILGALLAPTRPTVVRTAAAAALRSYTRLEAGAHAALLELLRLRPDEATLQWALAALQDAAGIDPAVLAAVVELAVSGPDRADMLRVLRQRLDASAGLLAQIESAVLASTSAVLWREAIPLFAAAGRDRVPLAALGAPAASVRAAALDWAEEAAAARREILIAPLAAQLPREPIAALRVRQAWILAHASALPEAAGAALLDHLTDEDHPDVRNGLGWALLRWRIPAEPGRGRLLGVFTTLLGDPTTPGELVRALAAHLRRLAVEAGGDDLAEILVLLIEQAGSLTEVKELDSLVRSLVPDGARHALRKHALMRRYHQQFPQDPLTQWARDIAAGAAAGTLPGSAVLETVRLTGATWLLEGAAFASDRDLLLTSVRRAISADQSRYAESAIREAYEQKTIRKRDLAGILRLVATRPSFHHLGQQAIDICKRERLITPEIVDAAWPVLLYHADGNLDFNIVDHFAPLAAAGDAVIAERARASCTPALHRIHQLGNADPAYTGRIWPIFTLLLASSPDAAVPLFRDLPPDPVFHGDLLVAMRQRPRHTKPAQHSLAVMSAAAAMWRSLADRRELSELRRELARFLTGNRLPRPRQHTGGDLDSRAWNEFIDQAGLGALTAPLPEIGAELWLDLCARLEPAPGKPPVTFPSIPHGISLEHLQRKWPYGAEVLQGVR